MKKLSEEEIDFLVECMNYYGENQGRFVSYDETMVTNSKIEKILEKIEEKSETAGEGIQWIETCEQLPTHSKPIILDCEEGIGEGYYKGKETFRFIRFSMDVDVDNVYRWAEMPKPTKR